LQGDILSVLWAKLVEILIAALEIPRKLLVFSRCKLPILDGNAAILVWGVVGIVVDSTELVGLGVEAMSLPIDTFLYRS